MEPGTGQKPVEFHTQNPASIKVNEPVQRQPENSTKGSIIEKFRGNEQYKRPYDIPVQPSADSVKVREHSFFFCLFSLFFTAESQMQSFAVRKKHHS